MTGLLSLITTVLALLPAAGDNPEFGYWADHKVGSWVKLKMEMDAGGVKMLMETHHTLVESGADKVVVEQKNKVTVNGMSQPESTEKEEILKDKEKNPLKIEKEGDEEISVNGKTMKCHWVEGVQEKSKVTFWLTKEVPGGIVKGEISGAELPGKMLLTATSWEKK